MFMDLEATHMRGRLYAVRPRGTLGTCGWINNQPWSVEYITAQSCEDAVRKIKRRGARERNTQDTRRELYG